MKNGKRAVVVDIHLLPLSVRMLDANIFVISSSSFNNFSTIPGSARLLSLNKASQSLLSLQDLREVVK
jgi:hypothetical protein